MKKKISRITENVFSEIHGIKEAMPGLTAKTVSEILVGRGVVDGIGVSTVNAVLRFPTYEEYKRYNEARTGTGSAASQAKPMDGQTEIELQIAEEEKPRMSEAARTMIGNQERILEELRGYARNIGEIVCLLSAVLTNDQRKDAFDRALRGGYIDIGEAGNE